LRQLRYGVLECSDSYLQPLCKASSRAEQGQTRPLRGQREKRVYLQVLRPSVSVYPGNDRQPLLPPSSGTEQRQTFSGAVSPWASKKEKESLRGSLFRFEAVPDYYQTACIAEPRNEQFMNLRARKICADKYNLRKHFFAFHPATSEHYLIFKQREREAAAEMPVR
jgi:hypothetical protein